MAPQGIQQVYIITQNYVSYITSIQMTGRLKFIHMILRMKNRLS